MQIYHGFSDSETYRTEMIHGNGWATQCEIRTAAKLLSRNIRVWLRNVFLNKESGLLHESLSATRYSAHGPETNEKPDIELLLQDGHFSVLYACDQNIDSVHMASTTN